MASSPPGGDGTRTVEGKRAKQRERESEREEETQKEALEMIPPALKRFCSSVVPGVRKIAVEGNIGE